MQKGAADGRAAENSSLKTRAGVDLGGDRVSYRTWSPRTCDIATPAIQQSWGRKRSL